MFQSNLQCRREQRAIGKQLPVDDRPIGKWLKSLKQSRVVRINHKTTRHKQQKETYENEQTSFEIEEIGKSTKSLEHIANVKRNNGT